MKKTALALTALSALFFAACVKQDPNEPPRYVDVPPPQWVNTVKVLRVSKGSARVQNSLGQVFSVRRSGTDIGGGLLATRDSYDLYIQDKDGVKCNWNSAEHLDWCRKTNPAYEQYHRASPK